MHAVGPWIGWLITAVAAVWSMLPWCRKPDALALETQQALAPPRWHIVHAYAGEGIWLAKCGVLMSTHMLGPNSGLTHTTDDVCADCRAKRP